MTMKMKASKAVAWATAGKWRGERKAVRRVTMAKKRKRNQWRKISNGGVKKTGGGQ